MLVYTVLLAVSISASISSRRTHPLHRHEIAISNRPYPIRRQYRERGVTFTAPFRRDRSTTSSDIRMPLEWNGVGLAPYTGNISHSHLTHREWEGGPVKHCPSGCTCYATQEPIWRYPLLMFVVRDCMVDPSPVLSKLFNSYPDIKSLMLDNCHLSKLPADILTLHHLVFLHLVKNQINEIPDTIQLTNIQYLVIKQNTAEHLNLDSITKLSHLQWLDLSANSLAALPDGIGNLRNLVYLNVSGNRLILLPEGTWTLTELICLDLSFTELEIPHEIGNLTRLLRLNANSNNIRSLPGEIGKLTQLAILRLDYNNIHAVPAEISKLNKLQALILDVNILQILPAEIGNLSQLRYLYLRKNRIQNIPNDISKLSELKVLDLTYNKIQMLPHSIGKLFQLESLWLNVNMLHKLPNEIIELNNLKSLWLGKNLFSHMPPVPTKHLVSLVLEENALKTFPCEPLADNPLVQLRLNHNDLKSFDCWDSCLGLVRLDLSYNAVQDVPCEAFCTQTIEVLNLKCNNISNLPEYCEFLSNSPIRLMSFSHNNLSTVHFQPLCGPSFQVSFIGLSHNRINTIVTRGSDLTKCLSTAGVVIDLSYNRLSTLDSWPLLVAEQMSITLSVSHNDLSEFTNSAGIFMPRFQYGTQILMHHNQIRYFTDIFHGWGIVVNTTENLNSLLKNVYFDLAGNPLVCDCVDYEVYRYIQTLRPEQYNNLQCYDPLSLRGQNPHLIPLSMFVCDLGINCPSGCTCSQVPHFQIVNITCRNYSKKDLPEMLPDLPNEKYTYRLDMCHQNLTEITFRPYFQRTSEILLTNNSIFTVKINSSTAFHKLKILHLDYNGLSRLPKPVSGLTNDTAVDVRLGSNPWVCDCEVMSMKAWMLLNLYIIKDKDTVLCRSPNNMVGDKVQSIDRSQVCPNKNAVIVVAIIGSIGLICIVYKTITEMVKHYQLPKVIIDECEGERKQFDIFISSSADPPDDEYIEQFLIPQLEKRDFRVLYHREHFDPGKSIVANISEAIEKSKRTLVFFSENYRKSGMCIHEFNEAHHLDVQNNKKRLITIRDTNLDVCQLEVDQRHYFRTHTYVMRDSGYFWTLLLSVLPKDKLGAQVRNEPA